MKRGYDDDYWPMFLGVGQTHHIAEAEAEKLDTAAVLWVPDPEQRHGWREYYVKKPGATRVPVRPVGFRKPGQP